MAKKLKSTTTTSRATTSKTLTDKSVQHEDINSSLPPLQPTTITYNPLSRLSKQIQSSKLNGRQPSVLPPLSPHIFYQPFKTLNTRAILTPATTSASQTSRVSTRRSSQCTNGLDINRTLKMPSEYESYVEHMRKVTLNSRPVSFAEKHFSTQDWLNKERGGPITRKYSAAKQSLLQRHRIRQKTFTTDDYTIDHMNRAFEYQQECKSILRSV